MLSLASLAFSSANGLALGGTLLGFNPGEVTLAIHGTGLVLAAAPSLDRSASTGRRTLALAHETIVINSLRRFAETPRQRAWPPARPNSRTTAGLARRIMAAPTAAVRIGERT